MPPNFCFSIAYIVVQSQGTHNNIVIYSLFRLLSGTFDWFLCRVSLHFHCYDTICNIFCFVLLCFIFIFYYPSAVAFISLFVLRLLRSGICLCICVCIHIRIGIRICIRICALSSASNSLRVVSYQHSL